MQDVLSRARQLYGQIPDAEVETLLREELARRPQDPEVWLCLAPFLLVQGKYREGFQAMEARGERRLNPLQRLPYPEWEGAPLAGRSILVVGEQGLGDEIQFSRFIPNLRRLGASSITLAVRAPNVRALEQIGADRVLARDQGPVEVPRHDCWVLLASLPHRLGVTLDTLLGSPYIRAEAVRRGGIAIVERGDPGHPNDARRSLPTGLLQEAFPRAELMVPRGDVLDSLKRLSGLDLLITVDTSWAHMAGALGVPCWVILHHSRTDWRWMRERETSPWYNSLRLYRQDRVGEWSDVVQRVRADAALNCPQLV
jgi:hypothetical protein